MIYSELGFELCVECRGKYGGAEYQTKLASRADLVCQSHYDTMWPGDILTIPTGVFITKFRWLEEDSYHRRTLYVPRLHVEPRSSLSEMGVVVHTGKIDVDYINQEIHVICHNLGKKAITFRAGARIAQLELGLSVDMVDLVRHDRDRKGGFGSTGV